MTAQPAAIRDAARLEAAEEGLPFLADGKPKGLLIDGEFVPAISGRTFDTMNPSTGARLGALALAEAQDVDRAVAAARRAFEGPWRRFSPAERQTVLLRFADLVERHFEELALLDTLEMGRPLSSSRNLKTMVTRGLRHFAGQATAIHGETLGNSHPAKLFSYTVKEPVGVVGAIIPWNGPVFSVAWKVAPVLATGCTIVLKAAEEASLSALRMGELCLEAGVPPGVVNIVTGYGEGAGAALAAHLDVDKVTFTGSCETGQKIIHASAANIKRVTLELGGKSANIVFADADLDSAVSSAAMAVFANSGQICSAGSRLFVERSIHEEFTHRVAAYGAALRIGDSRDPQTQIGPLVSAKQLDRVTGYLALGPREGARVVSGGARLTDGALANGYFVPPTVFADVDDSMRIVQEEIFGPVICAIPFDTIDEVIGRANATTFGLAGGVWTRDITKAHTVANRIRAGSVWVNHYQAMDPAVPFGGYKMSGYGREGGSEHIEAYLNVKAVWIKTD